MNNLKRQHGKAALVWDIVSAEGLVC